MVELLAGDDVGNDEPSQGKWHCESDNGSERSSEEDEVAEWGGGETNAS